MSTPVITISGTTVRIITDPDGRLDLPRRQSFAWPSDAQAYAERLAVERGWKIVSN